MSHFINKNDIKKAKIDSCFSNSEISKSEIGYAFNNSNPDLNSLKFNKKGEDLMKMLNEKKSTLSEKYNALEAKRAVLKEKILESKAAEFKPTDESDYDYASIISGTEVSDDVRSAVYAYNDLRYTCQRFRGEIKTLNTLLENLDSKKTYTLSTPQLTALQKAMEFDVIEKGGEGSKGGKVIGHTKSGKPIYSKFTHSSHENFTKEDHEDAAKIHNSEGFKNQGKGDILDGKKTVEYYDRVEKQAEHHFSEKEKHLQAAKK